MAAPTVVNQADYAHGHDPTVLKSHLWRTAENSCGYVLPHIKDSMKILDVGCGPGNITCDLAKMVSDGLVIGMDRSEDVISQAKDMAKQRGLSNVTFTVGNVFDLKFEDGEFDIVHAHQVLQHVGDASAALREMRRVTKPGGIIALRDLADFIHWPLCAELVRFNEIFIGIGQAIGGLPNAGRMLRKFAREAGFEEGQATVTAGTWCYADEDGLDFWCGMWKERVLKSSFPENAIKYRLATEDDLQRISAAWGRFPSTPDAWFTVVHGEMICRR